MRVELYVETSTGVYDRLSMYEDESVQLNFKLKELTDIAKAFSIYSQSFTVPADSNNNKIFKFYFNTDINRTLSLSFNAKIYINSELFKVGSILINSGSYSKGSLKDYNITFTTVVNSFINTVGETTINQLDTSTDGVYSGLTLEWTDSKVYNPQPLPLCIPLISTERVWTYGGNGKNDIEWKGSSTSTTTTTTAKYVDKAELRPAIRFYHIMDRIASNFGYEFVIPFDIERAYNRLAIHLTNENTPSNKGVLKYTDNFFDYIPGFSTPSTTQWFLEGDLVNFNKFKISTFTGPGPINQNCYFSIFLTPKLVFGLAKDNKTISAKFTFIDLRPATSGQTLSTKTVSTDANGELTMQVPVTTTTFNGEPFTGTITNANPLIFEVQVEFSQLCEFSNGTYYIFVEEASSPINNYYYQSSNNNSSTSTISFLKIMQMLPNIKVIDFISTFIKMFNIRLRQDDENNKKIYFERPQEWYNKTLDYSKYVDVYDAKIEPVKLNKEYDFKHKTSNYFSNINFAIANQSSTNGKEFGQLSLKIKDPFLKDSYKVETNASIVPQVILNDNVNVNNGIISSYGFKSDSPTESTKYGSLYKPNLGELRLFYDCGFFTSSYPVAYKSGTTTTTRLDNSFTRIRLTDVNIANLINLANFGEIAYSNSLGYKDEIDIVDDIPYKYNLYSNYYDSSISRIYNPNTRIITVDCYLPVTEINSFDLRNHIIVGEQIYTIEEASIDIVTGKSKLVLMNNVPRVNFKVINSSYGVSGVNRIAVKDFESTYAIAGYEIKIDNVVRTFLNSPEKYLDYEYLPTDIGKEIQITCVDIFGNRSQPFITTLIT